MVAQVLDVAEELAIRQPARAARQSSEPDLFQTFQRLQSFQSSLKLFSLPRSLLTAHLDITATLGGIELGPGRKYGSLLSGFGAILQSV